LNQIKFKISKGEILKIKTLNNVFAKSLNSISPLDDVSVFSFTNDTLTVVNSGIASSGQFSGFRLKVTIKDAEGIETLNKIALRVNEFLSGAELYEDWINVCYDDSSCEFKFNSGSILDKETTINSNDWLHGSGEKQEVLDEFDNQLRSQMVASLKVDTELLGLLTTVASVYKTLGFNKNCILINEEGVFMDTQPMIIRLRKDLTKYLSFDDESKIAYVYVPVNHIALYETLIRNGYFKIDIYQDALITYNHVKIDNMELVWTNRDPNIEDYEDDEIKKHVPESSNHILVEVNKQEFANKFKEFSLFNIGHEFIQGPLFFEWTKNSDIGEMDFIVLHYETVRARHSTKLPIKLIECHAEEAKLYLPARLIFNVLPLITNNSFRFEFNNLNYFEEHGTCVFIEADNLQVVISRFLK
jgi:hypothetical protein